MRMPTWNFALGAADGDIDMLIAHTLQNGLQGGVVVVRSEGHILFAQAVQEWMNLGGISLGLGEDCHPVERMRDIPGWAGSAGDSYRTRCWRWRFRSTLAQRRYRRRERAFTEIASLPRGILTVPRRSSMLFGLVPDAGIGSNGAGIDAEVGLLADKWIGSGFPDINGQGTGIVGSQVFSSPALPLAMTAGASLRGGHQVNDRIQQA